MSLMPLLLSFLKSLKLEDYGLYFLLSSVRAVNIETPQGILRTWSMLYSSLNAQECLLSEKKKTTQLDEYIRIKGDVNEYFIIKGRLAGSHVEDKHMEKRR